MKFARLAEYFLELEKTASRLKMTEILASLFKEAQKTEIDKIIYLSQERLVPAFVKLEFGVSDKLTAKAIARASGEKEEKIHQLYKKLGDYGLVGEQVVSWRGKGLMVLEVYEELYKVASASGEGAVEKKLTLLSQLLQKLSPIEVRYVLRIPLGKLRLGIGDPTILDALSYAYAGDKSFREPLERAYNLCSDLGEVAKVLFTKGKSGIEKFEVEVGKPIRMALAERLSSAEEILKKIGPCLVEAKYDGFRCQVHRDKDEVKIFSRNLEETTQMFPEIVEGARRQIREKKAILEGEAIAYNPDTGEYLPFQITVQRKRKYGIEEMKKRFPLQLFAFDLLYAEDEDLTQKPLKERRKILEEIIKKGEILKPSDARAVKTEKELNTIFEESISEGLEGIMAKRWDSPYQAGARNFNWIKLKRSYKGALTDTVDLVLVGYLVGRGARAAFGIGSLLGAVYDKKEERFKTVAKIGSGLSEEEWVEMKKRLDKIKIQNKPKDLDALLVPDIWVEPKYVVEVMADEITKSPVHTCGKTDGSGYALRFPRVLHFREDRKPEDATTVNEILKMYKMQRKAKA